MLGDADVPCASAVDAMEIAPAETTAQAVAPHIVRKHFNVFMRMSDVMPKR